MREEKIIYFDEPGPQNTDTLLKIVKSCAESRGIKDIVVATTYGETGAKAAGLLKGFNLVAVTGNTGYEKPGKQKLKEKNRRRIIEAGGKILTGTMALSGVERAVRASFNTILPVEIIANALRLIGQGMKVCVEISVMAADAGLIPVDRDIIAIAGTSRGADTAIILRAASSKDFFNIDVKEVLAKPSKRKLP